MYRRKLHRLLLADYKSFLPLLLILATSDCHILRLSCKSFADFSIKAEGHRLTGSVLHEIEGTDANECKGHCVLEEQCKSINVGMDGRCQLNGKSSHDAADKVNLTRADNWEFYTTNYSVRAIGQECAKNNPCNDLCIDTCQCPGYKCSKCGLNNRGIHCNRCLSNPCQHGGSCQDFGAKLCKCMPGYNGTFCELDRCSPNPCKNGGNCTSTALGFKCTCPSSFSGNKCETKVYSDDQWKTGCTIPSLSPERISFTDRFSCFNHCKNKLFTTAYIDLANGNCLCSSMPPTYQNMSGSNNQICLNTELAVFLTKECQILSSVRIGYTTGNLSCYNECVSKSYIAASVHIYDSDCYCSKTRSFTPSTVMVCIFKKMGAL